MEEIEGTISKITEGSKGLAAPIPASRQEGPDRHLFHHDEPRQLHRVAEHPAPEG